MAVMDVGSRRSRMQVVWAAENDDLSRSSTRLRRAWAGEGAGPEQLTTMRAPASTRTLARMLRRFVRTVTRRGRSR